MQGLGGTGAQQSRDCSFAAGRVFGAPLRVSWFLVIFFFYQLVDALGLRGVPLWVRVAQVVGSEGLLLLTILSHEMGHGTMARYKGGEIKEVLLWPFGGICFTSRAHGRNPRQKLADELWIVGAGPATHFPMALCWVLALAVFAAFCSHVILTPPWHHLIPFASATGHCVSTAPGCFHSWLGYLAYNLLVQAVQVNVMLFMFNVCFPMYPMDGAKLITCSLQLFLGVPAQCAAKVLIYTSVPLALLFVVRALAGSHGGGIQPGVTVLLGLMCLAEAWKIYGLMRDGQLHTHPLFELAQPQAEAAISGDYRRAEEEQQAPRVNFSELRPFDSSGRTLFSPSSDV